MFNKILVPVDLTHESTFVRSFEIAGSLAQAHGASICYVSVFDTAPTASGTPQEKTERLADFAKQQGERYGIDTESHTVRDMNPATSLRSDLIKSIKETGADAVVMASHVPGIAEHFISSNAGYVASHAPVSVFVVR